MSISWRSIVCASLLAGASALAGCGPHCSSESVCAVLGAGTAEQVCDGDDWQSCNDGNRGVRIACVNTPRVASCTTSGWTFENAAK